MNLMLTIKNSEEKKNLESVIFEKSQKMTKYLNENIKISWNFIKENGVYISDVKVSGFKGPEVKAKAHSSNMYKVVDLAFKKVVSQIRRKQDKRKRKNFYKLRAQDQVML